MMLMVPNARIQFLVRIEQMLLLVPVLTCGSITLSIIRLNFDKYWTRPADSGSFHTACLVITTFEHLMISWSKQWKWLSKPRWISINILFGENGGWAEDLLAVIADRIVDAGVHGEFSLQRALCWFRSRLTQFNWYHPVVVASGDADANGIFLTAALATGRKVIATGSIDNTLVAGHILHVKGLPKDLIGTWV